MLDGLLYLSVVTFAGFILGLSRGYLQEDFSSHRIVKTYRELAGLVKGRGRNSYWYRGSGQMLRSLGAEFHFGNWVHPVSYLVVRSIVALLGLLICSRVALGYGVAAAVVLFCLPNWLLVYLNHQDNQKMLSEIRLVYHALEIQLRAGVYVTDALAECYGSVRYPRLRQALLDLAGDLVVKSDVNSALERFQGKFSNPYIDSLCVVLLQALESGQAVELLQGIAEQIKDMEKRVLEQKKAALERSLTFYQLGILAAVLGMALYAVMGQLLRNEGFFRGIS